MNNNIREMDPLRRENWAGLYADVPEEVSAGVKLAYMRIRRHEERKRRMVRLLSAAACAAIVLGVCTLTIGSRKTIDPQDRVASPVVETVVLQLNDTVYSSNSDTLFHVHAECPHAGERLVDLQLVTALEFEKTLCTTCGANVQIEK
jgi:hypothetical protein